MSSLLVDLIYVASGCAAGLMSGLFGIGGGLVMVPALLWCFQATRVPADVIPAMALGTSLTVICFTSALAAREHLRIGTLRQALSRQMVMLVAMLALGVIAGAAVSTHLPKHAVLLAIACFELLIGAWMLRNTFRPAQRAATASAPEDLPQERLRTRWSPPFMALTGTVSAIGGIGGATLMIPYFARRGIDYKSAAALSTFFGSVIGAFGFVSYALLNPPRQPLPMSLGYVSVPAALSMAVGGYALTRYGTRLARRLPQVTLSRGFCGFLFVSGGKALLLPLLVSLLHG